MLCTNILSHESLLKITFTNGRGHFEHAAIPPETEMALALLGRGSLHPLTTWGENLGVRAYLETVRY